jgi:Methyltransferase domain
LDFGGFFRERRLYQSRWAIRGYRALRRVAERAGLQVVLKTFYSPIPELDKLPPGFFARVGELPGIDLDLDRQLVFLRERLAGPMAEFDPPPTSAERHRFAADNPSYSRLDASVLYAMVRALRPARVVELGSGQSTLVTAEAVRRNAADGAPCRYEAYDPYPGVVGDDLPGLDALHRVAAQDVPPAAFEALGDGDVLFIDTTHTVKTGSDVNHIVLDVLPRLAPGVAVHVHDIFLPFEYPPGFMVDFGLYWAEQYLLQAFLAMNPGYEILFACAALGGLRASELAAALPPGVPPSGGSAFWIRRTGG